MSSPSDPDEIVSMSIDRSFLPSFITEPLPNWRSIWESAADRALVLSMEDPSTIRRAVGVVAIDLAPYEGIRDRDKRQEPNGRHCSRSNQCTPSVLCSQ